MSIPGAVIVGLLLLGETIATTKYDPRRDAAKDISDAIAEAQRTGKNVLLEIGGEWCSSCRTLERYFESNPKITKLRDSNYVTVKVNWSPENTNEKVLSRYGTITEFPFFLVLNQQGKLLQAQRAGLLEEGSSYNADKMTAFLMKWAPKK